MAPMETLGILEEVEALVSDKHQVVSYKWLSRNFLVPSNDAKRLLQDLVDRRSNSLDVVYTVSGWLNNNPPSYKVRLVNGVGLEKAKQDFDGNCSVQVYSVQASIPRDSAVLWNMESIQAHELAKQPSPESNCLRDNSLCGIKNSFVKRNVEGGHATINSAPQTNNVEIRRQSGGLTGSGNSMGPPSDQNKVQQLPLMAGRQSSNLVKEVKTDKSGIKGHDQNTKSSAVVDKAPSLPSKGLGGNNSSKNGGSLSKLWGHATVKSKPTITPAIKAKSNAIEALDDVMNDNEDEDDNVKRGSNGRKRRVVFDDSDDECEDAVDLSSPGKTLPVDNADITDQVEDRVVQDEGKKPDFTACNQLLNGVGSLALGKSSDSKSSCAQTNIKDNAAASKAAPSASKRNKVLKTWIDERGREVTEVVSERDETEKKISESKSTEKVSADVTTKPSSRELASKKSTLAMGNVKAGGSKAGAKRDPKQGNILSFFKKV
ncbi:unnamed protein product [Linum trigynum]|uniref:DNA polymerase delta subunit 3 n=1 Tax=Linum trigynum TaxID=586398 RepID=A0AAV2EKX7_9ROSI